MTPLSQKAEPPALHDRAIDNLRYIRGKQWKGPRLLPPCPVGDRWRLGATAIAATVVAARQATPRAWLGVWVAEAIISLLIAGWLMDRRREGWVCPCFPDPVARWLSVFHRQCWSALC